MRELRALESADQERGIVEGEGGILWWKVRRDSADLTRASGCGWLESMAYNALTFSAYSSTL